MEIVTAKLFLGENGDMRCLITGTDDEGRSGVVDEREIVAGDRPIDTASLFRTSGYPLPSRPSGRGEFRDLQVTPGQARWMVSHWQPGAEAGMHHTDTLDFDLVLAGTLDLILDDGPHRLEAGDGALVAGVDHAWRAGPDGCTLAVVLLGTPPPT